MSIDPRPLWNPSWAEPLGGSAGRTALHLAAQFGQGDMAQLLLDAKAPLEVQDDRGVSRSTLDASVRVDFGVMVGWFDLHGLLL